MKAIMYVLTFLLITTSVFSCKKEKSPEVKTVTMESEISKKTDPNAIYNKVAFTIDGMTCAVGCAASIQKKISKIDGVKLAIVDFDKKLAMVEYDEAKVTPLILEETVTKVSETYKVSGMKVIEDFSSKKSCVASCKKSCCTSKKTCEPGCEKACCKGKKEGKVNEKVACKKAGCKKKCCAEAKQ